MVQMLAELPRSEVLRLPAKVLRQAEKNYRDPDGVLLAHDARSKDVGPFLVELAQAWRQAGVPPTVIAQHLSESSTWLVTGGTDALLQAIGDGPKNIEKFLFQQFGVLYTQVVQPRLNATSHPDHGFNDHSLAHIEDLLQIFAEISAPGGFSEQEKSAVTMAVVSHDIGNVVSRETHQVLSALLFLASYDRNLLQDPTIAQVIHAVLWHEASSVNGMTSKLLHEQEDGQLLNSDELLDQFHSFSSRLDSALRLLDKLSIGRHRVVNGHPAKWNRLVEDPHFLVNALFERQGIKFDETGKKCRVTLGFSLYPDSNLNEREMVYPKLHRKVDNGSSLQKEEFFVSQQMRDDYRQGRRVYFESATATLLALYQDRITLIALDFFNIFPELDEVELCLTDPHEFYHQTGTVWKNPDKLIKNEPIILRFHRSAVAQQVRWYQTYSEDADARQFVNTMNSLGQPNTSSRSLH